MAQVVNARTNNRVSSDPTRIAETSKDLVHHRVTHPGAPHGDEEAGCDGTRAQPIADARIVVQGSQCAGKHWNLP